MHVYTLGPLPTNGLAMLTKQMNANLGIMITASHNPFYDNGLKLFGPDGLKLSDKIEKKIEKLIDTKISKHLTNPNMLGRVKRLEDANDNYMKILKSNFPKNFSLRYTSASTVGLPLESIICLPIIFVIFVFIIFYLYHLFGLIYQVNIPYHLKVVNLVHHSRLYLDLDAFL